MVNQSDLVDEFNDGVVDDVADRVEDLVAGFVFVGVEVASVRNDFLLMVKNGNLSLIETSITTNNNLPV